jgi:class I fructose-bisphosphate aldolase
MAAGMDALVVSPGFLQANAGYLAGRSAAGIILGLEWTNTFRDPDSALGFREGRSTVVGTVEDALRLGADAVMTYIFVGYEDPAAEAEHVRWNAEISRQCEQLGMVRIIETMARGARVPEEMERKKEYVELHARIAYEIGCDLIKTEWTGDAGSFQQVVEAAPVPILLAGGPRRDPIEALRVAEEAIGAGAMGLVFGRNVVQAHNQEAMVMALSRVVHDGASAEEAVEFAKLLEVVR